MARTNKLVLLAGPGASSRIVYNALKRDFPACQVIVEDRVPIATLLQRRWKKLGWAKVAGQVLFRGFIVPFLRFSSASRIREIKRQAGLEDFPFPATVARVSSANSPATVRLLRQFDPDVVVINGTRILTADVLTCIPAPFINMHAGITPLYRGVHGAYWAMVERNERACGVTVHCVDPGIDTGKILGQAVIQPTPQDNFVTYPYLQLAAGLPLLQRAVQHAFEGKLASSSAPVGQSRMWSHPTLGEYVHNRLRLGVK